MNKTLRRSWNQWLSKIGGKGGGRGGANNVYYGQSESGDTDRNKFKQRRIKFGPTLKLNRKIYKIICCGLILSLV